MSGATDAPSSPRDHTTAARRSFFLIPDLLGQRDPDSRAAISNASRSVLRDLGECSGVSLSVGAVTLGTSKRAG